MYLANFRLKARAFEPEPSLVPSLVGQLEKLKWKLSLELRQNEPGFGRELEPKIKLALYFWQYLSQAKSLKCS